MFRLLEIKIEFRHLWMNAVNDLRYEIKFENRVKDKNNFLIKQNISFLFFKKNFFYSWRRILTASAFFLSRQMLKNTDMLWQKPRRLPNFECCRR